MYTGQIVQYANKHYFIAEIYKSDVHGPKIDCPILNAYFIGIEWQNFPLMYSFIHSFKKYLLSVFYVSRIFLAYMDSFVKKINKILALIALTFQ